MGLPLSPLWHENVTNRAQAPELGKPPDDSGADPFAAISARLLDDLAPIAVDLAARYARIADLAGYDQAQQELESIHSRLVIHDLNLTAALPELRESAQRIAQRCRIERERATSLAQAHQACQAITGRYGVTPPPVEPGQWAPSLNRMCCPQWWLRKIKVLKLRTLEEMARNIELVNRCRSAYASDHVVHLKRQQRESNRQYLAATFISNELGQSYSLQDLADRSVSNPAVRRAELMVRIRGFEMVADLVGHAGEFYTLTTPSRMHACRHDGQPNPRYDRTTPLQAHAYLTHLWALIRAELHRRGIQPYGFRVVEPHHDGTPHWHLLLFMPPEHRATLREVMQRYALLENGDEPGALRHRFKAVAIDPDKGTAAGYIAKYIAKNIDGHALEQDLLDQPAQQAAEHITTWATTWGIRQFQQIGGPSVTVWRQLRRLSEVDDEDLETLRQAATASDWAAFMLAVGAPGIPRRDHAIQPHYALTRHLDSETGEITQTLKTRYGDPAPQRVAGIVWQRVVYDTRKHFWTLTTGSSEPGQAICASVAAQRPDPVRALFRHGQAPAVGGSLGPVSITVLSRQLPSSPTLNQPA